MKWIVARACAVLLVVGLATRDARAAERVSIGLSYEADRTCPDGSTFARWVNERAPSVSLEPAGPDRAEVAVALRSQDGAFTGTLRIRRADGRSYVREMPGATCEELGSALAFVAALALREQVESTRPTAGQPDAERGLDETARTPSPEPAPVSARWKWGIAGGLGIRFGIAPTWANTEELDLEVGPTIDSFFAPVLRLGVIHAEPVTRIDRMGTTTFDWISARAAGCPLRVTLPATLELRPCIGVDWGSIGASGTPSTPQGSGRQARAAWVDAFGALRLRLHLFRSISAIAEAELAVPVTAYEFRFEPNAPVYAVPPAAAAGLAGLFGQIP